jgi:uncharacterized protein DUF6894
MPMYYFHLLDDETLSDVDGTDLIDVDAARAHATVVARELMLNSDGMLEQRWSAWTMSVQDHVGTELFSFALSDYANGDPT